MNVIILEGTDICYRSLRFFASQLAQAFKTVGCNTIPLNFIPTPESVRESADLLVGFNLDCSIKDENGEYVYGKMQIPVVDIIVDHPLVHAKSMESELSNLYVVCLDKYHVEFIDKFYPHIAGATTGYLTGAKSNICDTPISARQTELLMMGSYDSEDDVLRRIEAAWDTETIDNFYSVLEYMKGNPLCPTEIAITKCLKENNSLPTAGITEYEYIKLMWGQIDTYMR